MKLKKYIFSILFIFAFFLLCNTSVYASDLELRNLNYDVTLNSDGTANVTETWDISIEDTNTLFKTFEIDETKYSGISNVSLVETTKGINKPFTQIFEEQYHVDKDCFYALINSKGQFEIAWGVHEDDDYARRTFEMSYTIIDAVKNYEDASEFYWQFISTESAIPADKVTGTITLPTNVTNIEDFRVWAHGPLNGNITKVSNNTASFEVTNLNAYTMLEARIVTPTYVFESNNNISSDEKLSYILNQEQEWADEANRRREEIARNQKIMKFLVISFIIITNIIGIFLAVYFIKKNKKYKEELEKAPNIKASMPSKYFRDIPDDTTPAQAAFLYYFKTSHFSMHVSEVISATILDLCMKKYLSFNIIDNKKNQVEIILNDNANISLLSKDEQIIFELLQKVNNSNRFTMKDFQKYCEKHSNSVLKKFNLIEPETTKLVEESGYYSKNYINKCNSFSGKGVGFILLFLFSPIIMIATTIPALLCAIKCFKLSGRYYTLTQQGVDKKEQWTGLKNFMNDFSMMDQKEVPELVLWEKYLVYATAFGIADKVLKQLKVVYPQITDADYMNSNGYTYLYLMYHSNISNNFINSINTSVTSAYSSVNYSSGSGSGGGFSGGGGFGGGGGRNGRTLIYY